MSVDTTELVVVQHALHAFAVEFLVVQQRTVHAFAVESQLIEFLSQYFEFEPVEQQFVSADAYQLEQ